MAAKLSKQELEGPDIFQSSIEKITDYISENRTRFYVIVTAIISAVIIAFAIYFYWSNYQSSAVELYDKAQTYIAKPNVKPEDTKDSIVILKELIDKYPYSWSARMARYHLGNIYYNLDDLDNAISSYKGYISSTTSDNAGITFLALTSLGYCYEAKKDFKSALSSFEDAQKSNNTGFESMAYSNIGRIYELLNDKKKALENYQNALLRTIDPSMALFLKRKISSLS
jgi:predicted negative regulator of RcsB-dependent stress response